MSKATPASKPAGRPRPARRQQRLNVRGLVTLLVLLGVALPVTFGLKVLMEQRGKTSFLKEARSRLDKGQTPLALAYLNRYLELNPDDLGALELKSRIVADAALASKADPQIQEAARLHATILGRDPNNPDRTAIRRRLVRLTVRLKGQAKAAEEQAALLIKELEAKNGKADAEAYRLHALAWEQVATTQGNNQHAARSLEQALAEYQKAEQIEPGDVEGAELLAALYRERLEKPEEAVKVLDRVVDATASDPKKQAQALMARGRHYTAARDYRKAEDDFERAAGLDPSNVDIRLAAAEATLLRRDTAGARRHLAAVPADQRESQRFELVEGMLDMVERRPEDAIQVWRAGLLKTGGNDALLTWQLANVLLEVRRVKEAMPLIEQYRRLVGGNDPGPRYEYLVGLAALNANRPQEAIKALESVRYKAPAELQANLFWKLGLAYEANRENLKALEAYRESADKSKDWSTPWVAAAELQVRALNDPAEAAATLRQGLAQNPGDPALIGALTRLTYRQQMRKPASERSPGEVEALLKRANEAAPGSPEIAVIEAEYLAATKGLDEAVALLEAACRQHPEAQEVWLARAAALFRRGQIGEALKVDDEALEKAGPQAQLYIAKSSHLAMKGDITGAKGALKEGLTRVPVEQRPVLWKTLGDTFAALRDYPSAREAYTEWSKLQPTNPDPKVALVEVAIAAGDEPAIEKAVGAVREVDGPKGNLWKYARVQDLLRDRPDGKADPGRLDKADALVKQIQESDPQLALGDALRGRLEEKRNNPTAAIAAYLSAEKKGAGEAALRPLVALLVREQRDAELDRLRREHADTPGLVESIAAVEALRQGNKSRAEQLAAEAVKGNPQGLDLAVWQAEVLKALGKPAEAEAALRELTAKRPGEPAPWLQLLMLQVSQGKRAEAASTVEQIRETVKTSYPQLLWAQCYRAVGDFRRAAECYREALRRWPEESAVLVSAVAFFEQAGLRDDAEATLRAVLKANKTNPWARRKLAESLATRPNNRPAWDEAIALIGAEPRPDDVPEDLVTRSKVLARAPTAPQRAKAVAVLQGLLKELPDLPAVQELLARELLAQGRPADAREPAARAAAGDRASLDAVLLYAGVLLVLSDLDGAEAQLARLARFEPNSLPVAELRAQVLAARGKAKEGAEVLERAFEARAGLPDAQLVAKETVGILRRMNQPEAAERVARRAAGLGPRGRCTLAEVLAAAGKNDEAAREVEAAAKEGEAPAATALVLGLAAAPKADPRWLPLADKLIREASAGREPTFDLLDQLALLRHLQGRYRDEVNTYRQMLALKPANYLFLNNMAWTLCQELNDPKEALKWADQAVEKVGPQPTLLDTRGVIRTRLGDCFEAVRDLQAAVSEAPAATFYYHLAQAYRKLGKPDQARAARDQAKKAGLTRDQLQGAELDDWDAVMAL